MNNKFSLKLFCSLALAAGLCACSESSKDTAGGVSEETEGIYAIENKTIAGVSQKGPFVTGSNIYLKETKADGSLEPTGKEFYATTRSDKGDFKIENINLESPFALLTVEGYYTRETTNDISACSIHLNAVSNIEKRENVNINLLTHFEHQRILNLVKSGLTFNEAKEQASAEVFKAFGYNLSAIFEELDINSSSDKNRALLEISFLMDLQSPRIVESNESDSLLNISDSCLKFQSYIDNYTKDFADDGILSDSLSNRIINTAYDIIQKKFENFLYEGENELFELLQAHVTELYENFIGQGKCTENIAGKYVPVLDSSLSALPPPDGDTNFSYILCNGKTWLPANKSTSETIYDLITDPRDGKTYQTYSLVTTSEERTKQTTYEWMANNLQYTDSNTKYAKIKDSSNAEIGLYTVATALKSTDSQDSVIQGICPDGWHIPSAENWKLLEKEVQDSNSYRFKNITYLRSFIYANNFQIPLTIYDLIDEKINLTPLNIKPLDNSFNYTQYITYTKDNSGQFTKQIVKIENTKFDIMQSENQDDIGYVRCIK